MILIVDDDRSVTASLALLLEQAGHTSHAESSPEAALAWLGREPCQLVLQDMNFSRRTSGEEGLDLLARIRVARPDLPVVLITAWGSIGLAVQGMKAGASDFVTKPWVNDHLLQTVRTAIGLVDPERHVFAKPRRQAAQEEFLSSPADGNLRLAHRAVRLQHHPDVCRQPLGWAFESR